MDNKKFDDNIKRYFDARQINPSQDAWGRMDAMLNVVEKPSKIRVLSKYVAAASVLLLGILSYYIFEYKSNQSQNFGVTTSIMDTNTYDDQKSITLTNKSNIIPKQKLIQPIVMEKVAEMKSSTVYTDHKNSKMNSHLIKEVPVAIADFKIASNYEHTEQMSDTTLETVASSNIEAPIKKLSLKVDPNSLLTLVDAKINERKALDFHKEIKKKYGITPKNLLVKAEDKAAQTFMSKVWRTIQDKSEPVLTAVVNRNQ